MYQSIIPNAVTRSAPDMHSSAIATGGSACDVDMTDIGTAIGTSIGGGGGGDATARPVEFCAIGAA